MKSDWKYLCTLGIHGSWPLLNPLDPGLASEEAQRSMCTGCEVAGQLIYRYEQGGIELFSPPFAVCSWTTGDIRCDGNEGPFRAVWRHILRLHLQLLSSVY
jgi:hypothetical protein